MTADPTPVPPHLSDAERALWEKASNASAGPWVPLVILKGGLVEFPDAVDHFVVGSEPDDGEGSVLAITGPTKTHHAPQSKADAEYIAAANPAVILSLLTALSSEREAGGRLKALGHDLGIAFAADNLNGSHENSVRLRNAIRAVAAAARDWTPSNIGGPVTSSETPHA